MNTDNDNAWYLINNIEHTDSPALIIYLNRVEKNIELLKGMIDDVQRLRPHAKTHKAKEPALLMMKAGIGKFKCATIAEAEMLAGIRAPDVLLAYQPIGPKAERFISLIKKYPDTKFSCLVDNIDCALQLSRMAESAGFKIPVYIDLNVGMNRTGITPDDKAIELYENCLQLNGVVPIGLHAYDGHIHDEEPGLRQRRCDEAFLPVQKLADALSTKGFAEPVLVVGGSPTFPFHAKRKKVECSPGTFIYWDAGYRQGLAEQPFVPAALVISRVISLPDDTTICTDLGHKSVSAENELTKRISFINAPELKAVGQSEEHLVVKADKGHNFQIGDVLYGLPFHICPTCALYEKAFVVENGLIATEWEIVARDRKITV